MKKYKTIYASPPWEFVKRSKDKPSWQMKTKDIIDMSSFVKKISDENSQLYLWVTNNFLQDGLKVMNAWGFRYITKITWLKRGNIGLGQYFRGVTEDCLFGVKGKVPYKILDGKRQQGVTGFISPRGKHSEKPEEMRHMIERVSYAPYVEIFARPPETDDIFKKADKGVWDYIGNEIDGTDIRHL